MRHIEASKHSPISKPDKTQRPLSLVLTAMDIALVLNSFLSLGSVGLSSGDATMVDVQCGGKTDGIVHASKSLTIGYGIFSVDPSRTAM